ncbi:PAS domain-containing protein [Cupriavidus basilensis]
MVLNRIQAHVDGNTPAYVAEFRMRHKDGSYRQIAAHGVAVRDAGGHAVRMAGSLLRVTAKAASAEVAVSAASIAAEAPETLRSSWFVGVLDTRRPSRRAEAVASQKGIDINARARYNLHRRHASEHQS